MDDLTTYSFECPLLITALEVVALPEESWQDGEKWIQTLQARGDILGIVLPLEIKTITNKSRQDLHGLELLSWIRWSAEDNCRYLPVLVTAWQPLDAVLRHTPNLLLVMRGTTFVRLPEAVETLPNFIDGIRKQSSTWPQARLEDLERIAGGNQAEKISYHDLANEFYAAHRLWEGYKYAVQQTKLTTELNRINGVSLSFMESLNRKLTRPAVKEYLSSRNKQASPIYYPLTKNAEDLIKAHVEYGLPNDVRILMVDDEFDKGLAEVLLNLLFKVSDFSFKTQNEWVYTKEKKAKMVCTKSITEAALWLNHWGEMDVCEHLDVIKDEAIIDWVDRWAAFLERNPAWRNNLELEELSTEIFDDESDDTKIVDKLSQGGIQPTTIILLDLHLIKQEASALYDPSNMSSVRLWRAIKDENDNLPIIIFTASRQTMNYMSIMEVAGKFDGWLTKEGPDMTLTAEQSSRASVYLLERLHMFNAIRSWYRNEINWDPSWRGEYSAANQCSHWNDCLQHIADESTKIFSAMRDNPSGFFNGGLNLSDNIESLFTPLHFSIENKLVKRRVAVAALLITAGKKKNGQLNWEIEACQKLLNCKPALIFGKLEQPSHLFNFNHVLWFKANKPDRLLASLLIEEYSWLKQTFTESEYPKIHALICQAEP